MHESELEASLHEAISDNHHRTLFSSGSSVSLSRAPPGRGTRVLMHNPDEQSIEKHEQNLSLMGASAREVLAQSTATIRDRFDTMLETALLQLRTDIANRKMYVMFEDILHCDIRTDHTQARSVLPIFDPFIDKLSRFLHASVNVFLKREVEYCVVDCIAKHIQEHEADVAEIFDLTLAFAQSQLLHNVSEMARVSIVDRNIREKTRFLTEIARLKEMLFQKKSLGDMYLAESSKSRRLLMSLMRNEYVKLGQSFGIKGVLLHSTQCKREVEEEQSRAELEKRAQERNYRLRLINGDITESFDGSEGGVCLGYDQPEPVLEDVNQTKGQLLDKLEHKNAYILDLEKQLRQLKHMKEELSSRTRELETASERLEIVSARRDNLEKYVFKLTGYDIRSMTSSLQPYTLEDLAAITPENGFPDHPVAAELDMSLPLIQPSQALPYIQQSNQLDQRAIMVEKLKGDVEALEKLVSGDLEPIYADLKRYRHNELQHRRKILTYKKFLEYTHGGRLKSHPFEPFEARATPLAIDKQLDMLYWIRKALLKGYGIKIKDGDTEQVILHRLAASLGEVVNEKVKDFNSSFDSNGSIDWEGDIAAETRLVLTNDVASDTTAQAPRKGKNIGRSWMPSIHNATRRMSNLFDEPSGYEDTPIRFEPTRDGPPPDFVCPHCHRNVGVEEFTDFVEETGDRVSLDHQSLRGSIAGLESPMPDSSLSIMAVGPKRWGSLSRAPEIGTGISPAGTQLIPDAPPEQRVAIVPDMQELLSKLPDKDRRDLEEELFKTNILSRKNTALCQEVSERLQKQMASGTHPPDSIAIVSIGAGDEPSDEFTDFDGSFIDFMEVSDNDLNRYEFSEASDYDIFDKLYGMTGCDPECPEFAAFLAERGLDLGVVEPRDVQEYLVVNDVHTVDPLFKDNLAELDQYDRLPEFSDNSILVEVSRDLDLPSVNCPSKNRRRLFTQLRPLPCPELETLFSNLPSRKLYEQYHRSVTRVSSVPTPHASRQYHPFSGKSDNEVLDAVSRSGTFKHYGACDLDARAGPYPLRHRVRTDTLDNRPRTCAEKNAHRMREEAKDILSEVFPSSSKCDSDLGMGTIHQKKRVRPLYQVSVHPVSQQRAELIQRHIYDKVLEFKRAHAMRCYRQFLALEKLRNMKLRLKAAARKQKIAEGHRRVVRAKRQIFREYLQAQGPKELIVPISLVNEYSLRVSEKLEQTAASVSYYEDEGWCVGPASKPARRSISNPLMNDYSCIDTSQLSGFMGPCRSISNPEPRGKKPTRLYTSVAENLVNEIRDLESATSYVQYVLEQIHKEVYKQLGLTNKAVQTRHDVIDSEAFAADQSEVASKERAALAMSIANDILRRSGLLSSRFMLSNTPFDNDRINDVEDVFQRLYEEAGFIQMRLDQRRVEAFHELNDNFMRMQNSTTRPSDITEFLRIRYYGKDVPVERYKYHSSGMWLPTFGEHPRGYNLRLRSIPPGRKDYELLESLEPPKNALQLNDKTLTLVNVIFGGQQNRARQSKQEGALSSDSIMEPDLINPNVSLLPGPEDTMDRLQARLQELIEASARFSSGTRGLHAVSSAFGSTIPRIATRREPEKVEPEFLLSAAGSTVEKREKPRTMLQQTESRHGYTAGSGADYVALLNTVGGNVDQSVHIEGNVVPESDSVINPSEATDLGLPRLLEPEIDSHSHSEHISLANGAVLHVNTVQQHVSLPTDHEEGQLQSKQIHATSVLAGTQRGRQIRTVSALGHKPLAIASRDAQNSGRTGAESLAPIVTSSMTPSTVRAASKSILGQKSRQSATVLPSIVSGTVDRNGEWVSGIATSGSTLPPLMTTAPSQVSSPSSRIMLRHDVRASSKPVHSAHTLDLQVGLPTPERAATQPRLRGNILTMSDLNPTK
ncbi:hypothetical protein GMRT_10076 [Giardia muris]|uniref:Spindle pole protein n=1 Tax=Giardia muris TaxID=5742 RepID=A0A4Z1SSJ9_GIAMU|nr:hypothetical protein GMRT_10076 [Giardia muris]|eukprot:TNJ27955.1 hypothetical protein GMRT_10076 [Giardia muris]